MSEARFRRVHLEADARKPFDPKPEPYPTGHHLLVVAAAVTVIGSILLLVLR